MITYNHEKFIGQAIESVLMQETEFQVELVIGEDFSTDGTRQIVRDYAARYPQVIHALLQERNLGMQKNASTVLNACRGEYLAILEGDDYWTDPSKIARQVGLMDADPATSLCFHRVAEFDETQGKELGAIPVKDMRDFQDPVEELIRHNFIPTTSRMLRRSSMPVLDSGFENLQLGDWPSSIMIALNGKIGFIPEIMAVYRLHGTSTWSSQAKGERDFATYEMFHYLFQRRLGSHQLSIARSALEYSRLALDYRRPQGLKANIPLIAESFKIARQTGLSGMLVHLVWFLFYLVVPGRKGRWYDAICGVKRAFTPRQK